MGLTFVALAVVRGETVGLTPAAAVGQIFFVGLLATLTLGALIAVLKALVYLINKLRT